jgi:hypothetical protein
VNREEQLAAAYHEAGHCVMAWLLGFRVVFAYLTNERHHAESDPT